MYFKLAIGLILGGVISSGSASAANPWDELSDPAMAINRPDEYAWRLFVALNWPGNKTTCRADPSKKLGDAGEVTWEVWRSRPETYMPAAAAPRPWDDACAEMVASSSKKLEPVGQALAAATHRVTPAFQDPKGVLSTQETEEVRLNRAAYEFIRNEKLYSRTEQAARAAALLAARQQGLQLPPKSIISFPIDSKEVKAHWIIIRDEDKSRYHWAAGILKVGNVTYNVTYGLVALSITTKDTPNWFWATFEHVDNEVEWPQVKKQWPDIFSKDTELTETFNEQVLTWFAGWEIKSVDRFACKAPPHECNELPKGLGLEGTKWQYYRLRGTQVDFVDSRAQPTKLVNSKIEGIFNQQTMSCITCHALAARDASPPPGNDGSMPIVILETQGETRAEKKGYIGASVANLFKDNMMQLDFVWSLRAAQCDPNDPRPCPKRR